MPTSRSKKKTGPTASLMVRLDVESKDAVSKAAALRKVSVSDYVRLVTVAQARKEVAASHEQTIALTPAEQLAFWKALNEPIQITPGQKKLGKAIRGES